VTSLSRVLTQIYITSDAVDMFPEVMFFFIMSQVSKFTYDERLGAWAYLLVCMTSLTVLPAIASLQCRPNSKIERVDPVPFMIGVVTVLTQVRCTRVYTYPGPTAACADVVRVGICAAQFHSNYVAQFMKLVGEYVRFAFVLPPKERQRYPSVETTVMFTKELCRLSGINRKHLEEQIPPHILDTFV
jgi:hypothetical protein